MFVILTLLAVQQAQPTPPEPAPIAAEERICRREVPTGSNMPGRRICYSRAQWRERTRHNDAGLQSFRDATQKNAGIGLDR